MLFASIFVLFGVFMWVAAGSSFYFRRRQLRKTELMRGVETTEAVDVDDIPPGTPVEVKGTLRCEEPLTSEMAGQTCAYHLSRVIREYTSPDHDDDDVGSDRRSEVVASNERFAPFAVKDASGAVGVRGGAEVDALNVVDRFERDAGGGLSVTLGGNTVHLGWEERTIGFRYVESVLPEDAPVYVLGAVQQDGRIGAPVDPGGRFVISHRSEEQLERKYRRDALTLSLVTAGLSLFGLIFIVVGILVGAG